MYALYDPPAPAGLADDPDRRAFGSVTVARLRRPRGADRGRHRRASSPRTADVFDQLPFALTPGPPITTRPLQDSIAATAADGRARACPNLPADAVTDILLRRPPRTRQRRTAAPHRRRRRRHHRRAARPRLVLPRGARAAGHRQDLHRGHGHRAAGQRARLADRRGRAVARGRREPVPRRHRRRRRRRAGRQEEARAGDAGRTIDQNRVRRLHRRHTTAASSAAPLGTSPTPTRFRAAPRSAGHRGGRPVQPRQHHRGGPSAAAT